MSPARAPRYQQPDFREQRFDSTRKPREERYYNDRIPVERVESSGYRYKEIDNRYKREPIEGYPPAKIGYKEERMPYRESYGRRDRQESPRTMQISQREQYSRYTGIPEEFIKSDAATKPGVGFQAKPSEIRYHFYIICMNCKHMPVTRVKDLILKELENLGHKLNKEAVYVDDKDLDNEYKALVGFKFDHIALKCYDSLEKMNLPFEFRKELSRTFKVFYKEYKDYIQKLAYPPDPMMCPNQRIRRDSGRQDGLIPVGSPQPRYSQRSNERRISESPKRYKEGVGSEYKNYDEGRSSYNKRSHNYSPSKSPTPERKRSVKREVPYESFERRSPVREESSRRGKQSNGKFVEERK